MSSFTLKIIGIILMVIDHLGLFFPQIFPVSFRFIGRLSAPIFFFLLVEGYKNTHNLKSYIKRLGYISLLILIINTLLSPFCKTTYINGISPNITLTFTFSLIYLDYLNKFIKNKKFKNFIIILLCLKTMYLSEGGVIGIFLITFFYFMPKLTKNKIIYIVIYILGSIIISVLFSTIPQSLMCLSIIFIIFYNGKEGINNIFFKYFFYLFYPLHLWFLIIISCLI